MFTAGDLRRWHALPQETRDLARRYFLMYPEDLKASARDNEAVPVELQPATITAEGVKVVDRRSARA